MESREATEMEIVISLKDAIKSDTLKELYDYFVWQFVCGED